MNRFKLPLNQQKFFPSCQAMADKTPNVFIVFGLNLSNSEWEITSNIEGGENIKTALKDILSQSIIK